MKAPSLISVDWKAGSLIGLGAYILDFIVMPGREHTRAPVDTAMYAGCPLLFQGLFSLYIKIMNITHERDYAHIYSCDPA